MCGRFTQRSDEGSLREKFDLSRLYFSHVPRFNVAPTDFVGVVREGDGCGKDSGGGGVERVWEGMKWGLVPFWAKDESIGNKLINARGETAWEKPSFRAAFRRRRCIIPADGFYEWMKGPDGKQPMYVTVGGGEWFGMAGLWESWTPGSYSDRSGPGPRHRHQKLSDGLGRGLVLDERGGGEVEGDGGGELHTFTIITTDANEMMRGIHDRMPVILDGEDVDVWLDGGNEDVAGLRGLLRPYPSDEMQVWAVSRRVNKAENEGADLIEAVRTGLFE